MFDFGANDKLIIGVATVALFGLLLIKARKNQPWKAALWQFLVCFLCAFPTITGLPKLSGGITMLYAVAELIVAAFAVQQLVRCLKHKWLLQAALYLLAIPLAATAGIDTIVAFSPDSGYTLGRIGELLILVADLMFYVVVIALVVKFGVWAFSKVAGVIKKRRPASTAPTSPAAPTSKTPTP